MVGITAWSPIAASNALIGSIDWREGMKPRDINNSARYMMADVAAWLAAPTFPSGLGVTGALTVSTTLAIGTNLTVGGSGTFGGTLTVNSGGTDQSISIRATSGLPYIAGTSVDGATRYGYVQMASATTLLGSDAGSLQLQTAGATRLTISAAGVASFTGAATFGAGVSVSAGGLGVAGGLTVTSGGLTISSGGLGVNNGATINGGLTVATGNFTVAGTGAFGGAITQAGNQVWHAGNFDPTLKANLAGGAAFTGTISFGDANHNLQVTGGNARHTFDTGDYMEYDRTANKLTFYGGGVAMASINFANGNILTKGTIAASQAAV